MAAKILLVFDFDHTLVDGNTDTWVTKLCENVKQIQKNKDLCWTDRMAAVFRALHEKKFTKLDFESCLQTLPFTEGMKELLSFVASENIECIIISDSNTYFIQYILQFANLSHCVKEVYSNPATWTDDLLTIQHYHAHNCALQCGVNMCKREILKSYVRDNNSAGKTIVYVGDGRNDYCPTLQMKSNDYVFAREDYALFTLLKENGKETEPTFIPWKNGFDILKKIKDIVKKNT